MPTHVLVSDGIALNYLMGHDDKDIYIAFANTANKTVTEHIQLSKEHFQWIADKQYSIELYNDKGIAEKAIIKNGKLVIALPANGWNCVRIKSMRTFATEEKNIIDRMGKTRFAGMILSRTALQRLQP